MKQIRILKFEVGKPPYYKVIENDWRSFQKEVDGLFEFVYLENETGLVICCNDMGKINGSRYNRTLVDENYFTIDYIFGDFFIARNILTEDGGDLASIQNEDYVNAIGFFAEEPNLKDFSYVDFEVMDFEEDL